MEEELTDSSSLSNVKEHMVLLGNKMDRLKDTVKEHIAKDKQYYVHKEGDTMEDSSGLIAAMLAGRNGNEGGALGGAGGGFAGAALGSLLLSRGGLLGAAAVGTGEGCVTPSQLTAALAGVQDTQMNTAVLQTLGAIQGAIPLAEGQVQLALAGAVGEVRTHLGQVENSVLIGQTAINKNVSDAIAASLASQNNINLNVLTSAAATKEAVTAFGMANLTATKDAQFANQVAINASTKEILAALNDQNTANLQRQLAVAESALLETRLTGRQRESEINITNTNTATAQQAQIQGQVQAQSQAIIQLSGLVANLSGDIQAVRATTSNVNFGTQAGVGQTTNATNNKVGN